MTIENEHPITIIRADHGKENPYFQYLRTTAQDREVSWGARGIMAYLLSRSDNWKLQPKDLQQKCGKGKVYTLLNELIAAQYIVRFEARDNKTKRIDHYKYVVYEKPLTEKQEAALPDTENRDITYKRVVQKKEVKEKDSPSPKNGDGHAQPLDDNGHKQKCARCLSMFHDGTTDETSEIESIYGTMICDDCYKWLQMLNRDDCDSSASDVQLTAEQAEALEETYNSHGMPVNVAMYNRLVSDGLLQRNPNRAAVDVEEQSETILTNKGHVALEAYRKGCETQQSEATERCPACKIGQCLIDDVSDKTRCNKCDTEFDVQRDCSILDHGGSCDDCDMQGDCEIENGNCVLFKCSEPEQLPTSDTPLIDQAAAMLAIKNKMKSKHKRKSKSKRSEADKLAEANMWEAVKFVWELDDKAGGLIGKYRQWLFGKIPASKAKQFGEMWYGNQLKDCPATAQEVVAFSHWYRFTKPGMSMPGKGDTLKDNFDAFRGSGKDYEAFLRKAEDTIRDKIPNFSSPGIELAREQALPKEEEEIMEATPELRAEVDRLIAMCGKGGVK